MAVTNYQTSVGPNSAWIDVNTNFTKNNLPDRLADVLAISRSSLFNLFNCPIGSRGRIFQPTYGSAWYQFLQEPIDAITAGSMRIAMIQAIGKWEPRIKLDYSNTYIQADLTIPGYNVRITGLDTISGDPINIKFTEDLS